MYEVPVSYQGVTYNNSESAYQAQKNPDEIQKFIGITGCSDAVLIEGNYWHDYLWGICDGTGENHLGDKT